MFTHYELMKPLLSVMQSKNTKLSNQEALNQVINYLGLSEDQKNLKMDNGKNLIQYRLRWAKTYLKKAGLLESIDSKYFMLTESGYALDLKKVNGFSAKFLSQYPSFNEFRSRGKKLESNHISQKHDVEITPEELIYSSFLELNQSLKDDLLERIIQNSSKFFEQLVIDLLVAMGYGGSHQDAAQAIGKTNDGGVDGIINEDRLGLDKIYIQAKRWENTVHRPEIHKFLGALTDKNAKKGVFITTSNFSEGAKETAKKAGISLINGDMLTALMIEFGLGVQIERSFHIYKVDQDRFDEDTF